MDLMELKKSADMLDDVGKRENRRTREMAVGLDWQNGACGRRFVASFSGGKDSVLALYKSMKVGEAVGLIVVMEEEGKRSRSHGMPEKLIRAQAEAIGLPVNTASASWADYEKVFIRLLENAKQQGAEVLVTGDLDMPAHGCWQDQVTRSTGLGLGMPLWEMDHHEAVEEFVGLGFVAILVTVHLSMGMREDDLGRTITREYVKELEARGIDPCGESGEFHTTVIAGPIFRHSIPVCKCEIVRAGEYAFLPLELDERISHWMG